MLFEKLTYKDDFPINITIASIEEYPIHYHQDIEFVYVLKGEIQLKNGYCFYTLKEGDIFTNAGHEIHSLMATDKENVVALIQISTRYFSQYFPALGRACYRTYSNKPNKKHDTLREKLLQILLQYTIKSFNYKSECTYLMADIIKYLEKHFNLFAFEGDVVINFENNNQIAVERISHIINYIYQYYAEKIKLEDLAEIEHLSVFYISHLIKNCTGMNFREFLCFARVERSEILLLDTNKKVSQIAKEVGFSTTAYYEKYFYKWYKRTPQAHRECFQPLVKSDLYMEVLDPTPSNKAIPLIKTALSSLNSQKINTSVINSLNLEINAHCGEDPLRRIEKQLNVQVTCEDHRQMGASLLHTLYRLRPAQVSLLQRETDTPADIDRLFTILVSAGFSVVKEPFNGEPKPVLSYGNDAISRPIYLFGEAFRTSDLWTTLRLRDPSRDGRVLSGLPGALTSTGIPKPSYYAYQLLSTIQGDLICWEKHYAVVRMGPQEADPFSAPYLVLVYNFDDDIYNMSLKDTTVHQAKTILDTFKDEINFSFNLDLLPGRYAVMKYTLNRSHSIFSYYSSLDFSDEAALLDRYHTFVPTAPLLDVYQEDVRTSFHMNFSMKGVEIQWAIITPIGGTNVPKASL